MVRSEPNTPAFWERSFLNPFLDDIFSPGHTCLPGVASIHPAALSRCVKAFESLVRSKNATIAPWGASGRTILLAAPRAGYGKSHLVGRIRGITESLVATVSLPFDPVQPIAWESVLNSVVNQYRALPCPQHQGCSLFDETARSFQSRLLLAAVEHGNISAGQLPESEEAIRSKFREVFDPAAGRRLPGWLEKNANEVIRGAMFCLTRRWSIASEDLTFWSQIFLEYAKPKQKAFENLDILVKAEARKRLMEFLRIASDCRPVAFIADHLDGFFGSDMAGMQIAEILITLRAGVPRSLTLLCLNEDLWNSIFERKIPSAWVDRLTGEPAALGSISTAQARELIAERLQSAGTPAPLADRFLEAFEKKYAWHAGGAGFSFYPREVFRMAAMVWENAISRIADLSGFPPGAGWPEMEAPSGTLPANPFQSAESPPPLGAPARSRNEMSPFVPPVSDPRIDDGQSSAQPARRPPARILTPQAAGAEAAKPTAMRPFSESYRAFTDEDSTVRRAAGIDPTRQVPEIERLILEIRSGGRAISETPARPRPPSVSASTRINGAESSKEAPADGADDWSGEPENEGEPPNPFWGQDLEIRLQELETESLRRAASLDWNPGQIVRLVGAIGERFPAVHQREGFAGDARFLQWQVRGWNIFIGFELATNLAFWGELFRQARASEPPVKVALLSNPVTPFEPSLLPAMGIDRNAAIRYLDILEMNTSDMALLHAAEQFLKEAQNSGQIDPAIRIVARRLDPFWRRISRPLASVEPAA